MVVVVVVVTVIVVVVVAVITTPAWPPFLKNICRMTIVVLGCEH